MNLNPDQISSLKKQAKNLKIKIISESEDPEELPQINFHTEEDLIYSFYLWTKWQKKEWWVENYEVLDLLKKHLQQNLNRRKYLKVNTND